MLSKTILLKPNVNPIAFMGTNPHFTIYNNTENNSVDYNSYLLEDVSRAFHDIMHSGHGTSAALGISINTIKELCAQHPKNINLQELRKNLKVTHWLNERIINKIITYKENPHLTFTNSLKENFIQHDDEEVFSHIENVFFDILNTGHKTMQAMREKFQIGAKIVNSLLKKDPENEQLKIIKWHVNHINSTNNSLIQDIQRLKENPTIIFAYHSAKEKQENIELLSELREILESSNLKSRITKKKLRINLNEIFLPNTKIYIKAIKLKLKIILHTLIENAIKYSPAGEEIVTNISLTPSGVRISCVNPLINYSSRKIKEINYAIVNKIKLNPDINALKNGTPSSGRGIGLIMASNIEDMGGLMNPVQVYKIKKEYWIKFSLEIPAHTALL